MRVLLADDHKRVRSALGLLLKLEPGIDVVGEAAEVESLIALANEVRPDLVLLDWELPGPTSTRVLRTLRAASPQLKVIALSVRPEARRAALAAGADTFVSKGTPSARLLAAMGDCWARSQRQA